MAAHRIPPGRFIVVADSGVARILRVYGVVPEEGEQRSRTVLEEIARLDSPAARESGRDLVTDRTGRVFDSGGRAHSGPPTHSRHGAASDYDPHDVETERFAKRLAEQLDAERQHYHIEELVLIAAPRFLGVLRPHLSAPTRKLVTREVASDLTHAADEPILHAAFA